MGVAGRRGQAKALAASLACAAAMALLIGAGGCQRRSASVEKEDPPGARVFTPEWYDETPADEDGVIYETAQGLGATRSLSENIATNQARQGMALVIEGRVDVLQRAFTEQIDTSVEPYLLRRFQNVNSIVASQMLRGSRVIRKETYREGDSYRTFVMMALDPRAIDAAYLESLRSIETMETRLRSTEAWKELERRAAELREERFRGLRVPMTDEELQGGGG